MNEDVYEEEKDDHKEPDVDQFDGRAGGQRTRHVREERVEHQQRREGHDGAGVEGVQAQEERRPAHQQEHPRRQESGEEDDSLAAMEVEVDAEGAGAEGPIDPLAPYRVGRQRPRARVEDLRVGEGEGDIALVLRRESQVDAAVLDVEGITVQVEVAGDAGGEALDHGQLVHRARVLHVWERSKDQHQV